MVDNSPRQWLGLFWWHQRGPNYAFGTKNSVGQRFWLSFNRTQVQSLPCLLLVTPSLSPHCETRLMWPWLVEIHATSLCLTSCCPFWQPCCWHQNKTKSHVVDVRTKKNDVDVGTKQKTIVNSVKWGYFTSFEGTKNGALGALILNNRWLGQSIPLGNVCSGHGTEAGMLRFNCMESILFNCPE